jgi:hypothetical protein
MTLTQVISNIVLNKPQDIFVLVDWPEAQELQDWLTENNLDFTIAEQGACFVHIRDYAAFLITKGQELQ